MNGRKKRNKAVAGFLFLFFLLISLSSSASSDAVRQFMSAPAYVSATMCDKGAGVLESPSPPVGYILFDRQDRLPLLKESENQDEPVALPALMIWLWDYLFSSSALAVFVLTVSAAVRGRMEYLRRFFFRLIPARAGPAAVLTAEFASVRP